jgi:hypothetical protein
MGEKRYKGRIITIQEGSHGMPFRRVVVK